MIRLGTVGTSGICEHFLSGEKINILDMSLCAGTLMDLGVYCVYGTIDFLGVPNQIYANTHYLPNGADGSGMAVRNLTE